MAQPIAKFSFDAPVTHVWKDDSGRLLCEGVASSTALDSQEERVSKEGLELFGYHPPVELFNTHSPKAGEELGITVKHGIGDDMTFRVVAELYPDVPAAAKIWQRMQAGAKYGLSFGGTIEKAHWEYEETLGKRIRILDAVNLDHIAITRAGHAANPDCWLGAIGKSLDEDGAFLDEDGTNGDATDGDAEATAASTQTVGTDTDAHPADADQEETPMEETVKTEETQASDAEATKVDEPTTDETTEQAVEKATPEPEPETEAAKSAPAVPDFEQLIQKAVDAGMAAAKADAAQTIETLEGEVAKATEERDAMKAELDALKVAPANGGPESKPSGSDGKTEPPVDGAVDYIQKAIDAGDLESGRMILAHQIVLGSAAARALGEG